MNWTDIFIKRPVLATVVSLVILLLGLRAGMELTVRQYPEVRTAAVNITVSYPGADAELIQGFVTTPLEREIASVGGIDYMTSSSSQGQSRITVNLRLDKDPNEALTEISTQIGKLRRELPEEAEDPVIEMADAGENISLYISVYSNELDDGQITDYLTRVVEPPVAALEGVQRVHLLGARTNAMRVWLDPDRLAAHDLTAGEVFQRIRQQNVLAAVGETKGNYVRIGLSAGTDLSQVEEFRRLELRSDGRSVVRLEDVANVVLGAENYNFLSLWDGDPAIFLGLEVRPDANLLEVIENFHKLWPGLVENMPAGLEAYIAYDTTVYVRDAIDQVQRTLLEAVIIVVIVIFLFLGSVRSALIPAVTVPLSLVGSLFLMFLLGFSINLLTLLAMVLAIGMVVDDAIIVVENVHRHIEEGMKPFAAAIAGARELVGPIIAMSLTLVAVYAPIGFLTGITGTLFTEFAFTLAGAVVISGVIALTLTPMLCSRILRPESEGEPAGDLSGPQVRAVAPRLQTPPARRAGHQAGGGCIRRHRAGFLLFPVCLAALGTGAGGRYRPVLRADGGRRLRLAGIPRQIGGRGRGRRSGKP
jgi:multidrug efflux pump